MINVIYVDSSLSGVELWIDNNPFYWHDKDLKINKLLEGEYAHIPLRRYSDEELLNAAVFMNGLRADSRHQMTVWLDKVNNRAAIGTIVKE